MKIKLLVLAASLLVVLNVKAQQLGITISHSDVSCFSGSDGSATANATGGLPPYTYSWSNGATTRTINNLVAGQYTCTVTGLGGNTAQATVTIAQPPVISFTTSKTDVRCFATASGSATVTVSGGTAPYTYNWSPRGGTGATANNLTAGTYTCTITDAHGCDTTATVEITAPTQVTFTVTQTNVLCNGGTSGSATVNVTGGTAPYTYDWSGGAGNGATVSNLSAGTYNCNITDANGCNSVASVTITEPSAITFSTSVTDVLCNGGATGSATVNASGGTAPYTYSWSSVGGTAATAGNLAAGTYTCTITDANDCEAIATVIVVEPAALAATASKTDVLCFGGATGSATVNVSGGTAPYTYSWSPGGGTGATANNLAAGTYTCTVTDANGCETTATVTIAQPSAAIGVTTSQVDVLCNGAATGSATVTVTGGTAPYTYSWSPGGGTAATAGNLTAGVYICTITDNNGCVTTASVTITEPDALGVNTSKTDVLCFGEATGTATVAVSGGVAPYTYSWSPGGGTGATAGNLAAGTYTCTITDANGCVTTASVTVNEPTALTFTPTQTNILCFGTATGSATVTPAGGTAPYSYSWSSGATGATANNLIAGTYTCTITDANGCEVIATITVTQLPQITFTTTQTNVLCTGGTAGSATVNVSGGTAPYTYSWLPSGGTAATANGLSAGTYTCTITDANGCDTAAVVIITEPTALAATATKTNVTCNRANDGTATAVVSGGVAPYTYSWTPGGQTTATITGLGPGTYTCTATDANGCIITGTVSIVEPTLLTATSSATGISCNGGSDGSVTASGDGGTAPYTYSWSNGATTATSDNLSAGTYTCTVTDANGCTATTSATVNEPSPVTGTTSNTDVTCNGLANGTATVNPGGGTAPYTYLWSNGGTTQTINNLAPGDYTVTITDANGCTFDVTAPATITEPPALSANETHTNVLCNGEPTGTATAIVTGGTAPYSYQWSPSGGTGAIATGLAGGNYTCNITDANGCVTSVAVTIEQHGSLTASFTASDVSCKGASDGSATATPSGGTAPYTYSWAPGGETTPTINNLAPGTYTCTITDVNGCTIRQTVEVDEPELLTAKDSIISNVSCNGLSDGIAMVTPKGGTAPYTYAWSPGGATTQTVSGLAPGTYTCVVTDANGCTTTTTTTITEPPVLDGNTSHTNVTTAGGSDGTATASGTGGTAPYSYSWSPGGATTSTITGLATGTYTCTITDANGCTTTESVTITDPTGGALTVTAAHTNISCNGANDGTASVSALGGTAPYTYSWSPGGGTTATITGLGPGTYTCTVTDNAGGVETVSVTVSEPAPITASATGTDATCNGGSDGSAVVVVAGGTPAYTYNWSNGATNDTVYNLIAGTYTCDITDANGCTTQATVTIGQPAALAATTTQTNSSCNGSNNGIATVNVTGGTAPYSYSWSPSGGPGKTATGLTPGTYTCTITDVNNCITTVDVTITEPAALAATADVTSISCNGANDGTGTAIITGGTAPYTYIWDPGGQTTPTISNLGPGTYTARVTDANGCKVIGTFEITQPATLTASISHVNTTCNGDTDGSATANAAGGTAPYTYSWSNGATTQTITGLAPGAYTCTVTDANSCTATANVTIAEPAVVSAGVSKVNVNCNGGTDGSITLSGTGGTAPYTYLWGDGQTTATITNLAAGTYTCTITDSQGCTGVVNVTITQPIAIAAIVSQTDVDCNGNFTGTAFVAASGGTGPYTYNWAPSGGTGSIATGLAAGVYTCTITDTRGCTGIATVTILQPDVLTVDIDPVNVTCNGANDGTVTLTPSGGTAPYTYLWSTGSTSATVTGLTPGTHSFTITDANNCQIVQSIEITQPAVLTATSSHTNISCAGGNNGTATATPAGGTAPYTYSWTSGATTATATGLTAGTYTCTVTDANGCTATTSTTLSQPAPLAVVVAKNNVSCNGAADGTAGVTVSGGESPYTYLWSNSATTASISGLAPGAYSCTIIDARGCDTSISVTITEPAALAVTTAQTNELCNGAATGAATVTVTGGTLPYTYSWSPSGGTGARANNLTAGTYTCTITDANGCQITATVTITEPPAITFTTTQTDVDCNGNNTGAATVTASGGVGPYTYRWSPAGGTGATANNLTAGTYTCTITDANSCVATATVVITQPDVLSAATSKVNVNCNGGNTGSATVTVTGGTAPFTYLWSNGGTAATINNLTAGVYTVAIGDANGCTTNATAVITQKTAVTATVTQDNVLCNGGNTGSISAVAAGGTAPYTYLWNNGETTPTIYDLPAGTYTATITDVNGCTGTVSATITEPVALSATTSQVNVNCNGGNTGSATITVTGGTGPYQYNWSTGATTATINNLIAGTYTVTATDENGCNISETVIITETAAITATVSQDNVLCNGGNTGSISLAPSGGTAPYTYLWSNGATTATITGLTAGRYTCTITGANGCTGSVSARITEPDAISTSTSLVNVNCNGGNTGSATVTVTGGTGPYNYLWSNGANTATINDLIAGVYTVTVTDANGCVAAETAIITETAAITAAVTQSDVLCNGGNTGSISLSVTGGTAPYTYLWNNGATTAAINDLTAGIYSVTITDANACDTAISITVAEPDSLGFTTSQVDVNCNGGNTGSATVTATGGTSPYSYLWSTGGTTATINNLTAGTYTVTITDANGCDTTATVTITETAPITVTVTQDNVLCNGDNTGSISVVTAGGTAPYTYLWNNGATTATVNNLTAGTYTATITDVNGCDTAISVTVTEPDTLTFTTSQVNVNCNGGNTGSATVNADGGTRPYRHLWSTGAMTATINGLTAGTYTCTITDANGCDTTATVIITETDAITAAITQNNVLCNGGNTGSISVATAGGTAPYTYLWNNGATTATVNNLTAGVYTATITDVNGCDTAISVTITEPDSLSFTTSQVNVNCNGGNTGSATVTVTGGTSPYSYLWSNGGTTATINNLIAGTYTVTITDANGCDTTASVILTETAPITVTVTQDNVLCNGDNTGSISVVTAGGTAPYTYLWNNGATTATVNNLIAGVYTATITDVNGCDTAISVTVTEPDTLGFTISQVNVNCNGGNTGSATITATGGTSPYSYLWSTGATTATINDLAAGTYTVTISDANGCDTTTTVVITETAAITAAITQSNVLCNGGNTGSISLSVTGGTAPYTYLWNNGAATATVNNLTAGVYTATITDVNGCDTAISVTITEPDSLSFTTSQVDVNCHGGNTGSATVTATGGTAPYNYLWSNGGTTATINNLTAGAYTVTITDGNGCDTTATVAITETDVITAAITQNNVLCSGGNTGSISVVTAGGTAPYTYLWNNGATTATVNNLTAGMYTATITDANGCDTAISVTVTEPDTLGFTTSQVNVNCNGGNTGSATITATGGTSPYSYLWSTGATSATINNLAAGNYSVTISDANGCDTTATVVITETAAITAAVTQNNVLCNGGNTGSISVVPAGGTAPYTYLWNNGATTATVNNLTAGIYTATITDANGCDTAISVTITEPGILSYTTSKVDVICNGGNTGSATVTVTGGTAPYTYLWSNGGTTSTISNLTAGTYTATITDANGCDTLATITLTETAPILITTTQTNADCSGSNTGSASVAVSGGTAPYTYLWSNGATTSAISNLSAGTYSVRVTDATGCSAEASVVILFGSFDATMTVADENGNGAAEENELLTYTIRVRNTGTAPIANVIVTDPVPVNTAFVNSTNGSVNNNVVSFTDTNLGAGETRDYTFTVRANSNLQGVSGIDNTATVKTGADAPAGCTRNPDVSIPVQDRRVDLSILKQTDTKPITVPDRYEYTITVTNVGATAYPVTITDVLPAQISYLSNTASRGVAEYDVNTRTLTWRLDSLHDGENETLTLRVQAEAMGTVVNTARVSSPQVDIDAANNTSTVEREVIPFKIPNVFTPNGNGRNDKFVIRGLELYVENELLVFNRWNANVYHKKNYQNDWDGSGLNEGTYFYILKVKDSDNVWHTYKGNVLILRH
ncbi:gliding motility-associated C-terminal domain-containing protein [Chitinophaga barathri]|uniref:DUF11 domain-containing protein n=1 Tax=Chitinophaga barathri TaxID=1647451 RepID=A0A3N4M7P0_9BACT|nr:gliding motility-associated C-terminal domain-containing protein [Chitinophaga barathri]RPD39472.1 DUF11 domain-containing protein [Chitinophaga barathri]